MYYAVITSVLLPGNGDVVLLARIRGRGGYLTQATVSTLAWYLTDATMGTIVTNSTFTVSSVVFDQLQIDHLWAKDATGYNFRGVIGGASIPLANSGNRMAADVKFTMASAEIMRVQFNWLSAKVYG